MQSLDCGSESVIIYRARLQGTSQRDSSSFINLIEDWVSSGPSFIVTELLMTVDSQCTVVILSLSDHGDCTQTIPNTNSNTTPSSSSSDSTSSDTAAIIGGVVAVVIVIVIVIGVVAIVALVMKSCQTHGDVVVKKQ